MMVCVDNNEQRVVSDEDEDASVDQLRATCGHDKGLRIPDKTFELTNNGVEVAPNPGPHAPIWQFTPAHWQSANGHNRFQCC